MLLSKNIRIPEQPKVAAMQSAHVDRFGFAFVQFTATPRFDRTTTMPSLVCLVSLLTLFIAFLLLTLFAFNLLKAGLEQESAAFMTRLLLAIALVACGQVIVYFILYRLLG